MDRKEILRLIQAKQLNIEEGVKLYTELTRNAVEDIRGNACIVLDSPCYIDNLKLTQKISKEPGNDEIQIDVRSFSLNFGDLLCIKGLYPTMPPYPFTPGFEVAGIVTKVGKDVKRIKVGEPVISIMGPQMGGHSSVVTVSENWAIKKPDTLSFEEACSLPITFMTVYHIFETIKVRPGEKILIQTAAGGTGLIAVQLAMNIGAEIYATAGSDEKLKYLKDMGITNLINYRQEDFYQRVMEMTDGHGVDVVLNTLSGEAIQEGMNLLGSGGRYVEIAMTGLKSSNSINLTHMVDNQSFYSVDLRRYLMKNQELVTKYLDIMIEYVERGIIKPTICKVFKFLEIKQAFKCLEDRKNIGKIVVSVSKQTPSLEVVKPYAKKPEVEDAVESSNTIDIAVIGMSARFPGSPDIKTFWENLVHGKDLITEIPIDRWDWRDYYHPDPDNLEKTNSKWGGFLENADLFDPSFFKISGREAEVTDPQQRVFLEECWNALEDAGYASEAMDSKCCGVFAGAGGGDYQSKLRENNVSRIPQSFWGNESSVIPARIAYFLNLKGPAISINTACSSSLVAIHLACRNILAGDCNMALAGGVFICTTPEFYILSSNANMLSPDGRCKAFDKNANGFVPGEGAGVIVLKRLDEALSDGDHIYGVIKGSSINQDGRTNGITAPNSLSQSGLLTSVYERYGVSPETISYIEAHGTGTELGDPIEVGALTEAFGKFTSRKNFCWLGSVKANIGHAVFAAGVAGVIKVLLALEHGSIPPQLHFNEPNKHINFEDTPFRVNTGLQEWKGENGMPRRAGVSSFGFSGTNAHIIIEESPDGGNSPHTQSPYYFIPLSAKSEQALKQRIEDLYKWLESGNSSKYIGNIAYTLLMRRAHFPLRLAFAVRDTGDLMKKLDELRLNYGKLDDLFSNKQKGRTSLHNQDFAKHANELLNELNLCSLNRKIISDKQYLEKLSIISEFYIKQYPLDWERLYMGCGYNHVSMPTYPFQKNSYRTHPMERGINCKCIPQKTVTASETVEDTLAYYRPDWIEQPLTDAGSIKMQGKNICIFGMEDEIYCTMKNRFYNSLSGLIRVIPGEEFNKVDKDTYVINPAREDHYICLISEMKIDNTLPSEIIYAWSGSAELPDNGEDVEDYIKVGILEQFYSLAYLARAFMRVASGHPVGLTFVCHGNTTYSFSLCHGLSAFFRTLHIENPLYRFHSAQFLTKSSIDELVDLAICEVGADVDAGEEITYENGKRRARELISYLPVTLKNTRSFKSRGVYWLAGGAGGIGRLLVQYLVEEFDATVYISGRSDEPKTNKDIKGRVAYIKGDISQKGEAKRIYRHIISEVGSLNGVINLAGIIKDKYLINKSAEDIRDVLAPKCWGTYYLDEATANEKLDFFMVFSSIVSFTGNSGQSDYSFANGFMDGFIQMRNMSYKEGKRWGNSMCINWPVWEEGGMRLSPQAEKDTFEVLGLRPLGTLQGINALAHCIQTGASQISVIYGNNSKFENLIKAGLCHNGINTEHHSVVNNIGEGPEQADFLKWTENRIKLVFAEVLRITTESFDIYTPFEDLGLDSLLVKSLNTGLEEFFNALPRTLLFECSNIKSLAEYIVQNNGSQVINVFSKLHESEKIASVEKMDSTDAINSEQEINAKDARNNRHFEEDIAIIGMSGRLPQAKDINEFWENLMLGKDCITEIPAERWDIREYYHPDPDLAEQGKMYCKWGGFIENISSFDSIFFNIPPRKAELMDPQERLLLQTSWLALEDGGYNPREFSKKYLVGVFVGATTHSYQLWGPGEWMKGNHIFPESSAWSLANRISYFYDFKGPSMPVDTACSSSLTAVHQACGSIRRGECEVAIVGGVNIYLHPSKYIGLCQMRMLSKEGRCKSFAQGADGFVPGEGVAAVVLKPLSRAIKDKDNIYAVIKGSSVNHGGRTNGYTVPNPDSQTEVICRAFEDGKIEPLSVTAIEAHGTGTALGDPIEIRGLTKAFGVEKKHYCAISSSKSNIGHLESAAGIAGLIKMALQLKNKTLVPTLHVSEINKDIPLEDSPFFIQKELNAWEKTVLETQSGKYTYPRRGGISSFGAGGANAHVILEEYDTPQESGCSEMNNKPFLIVLSAKTIEALLENCRNLYDYLEKSTSPVQGYLGCEEEFKASVNAIAAEILGVSSQDILKDELFEDIGMDAVSRTLLLSEINNSYHTDIKINILLTCKCLSEFAEKIYEKHLLLVSPMAGKTPALGDIAYTLQVGRESMEERIALVVSSIDDLISGLKLFTSSENDKGQFYRGNASCCKTAANNANIPLLIENRDYYALASLWVSGADIDWEAFNRECKYHRVSLPGYSFAAEHYWIPMNDNKLTITAAKASPEFNVPLRIKEFENKEYKSTIEFDGDEFYIRDHVFAGGNVMPASAYLNMVCSCYTGYNREKAYKMSNLLWMRPFTFSNDTKGTSDKKRLHIVLNPEDRKAGYEVYSMDGGKPLIHHTGEIEEKDASQITAEEFIDIESIKGKCHRRMDRTECYNILRQGGILYGQSLCVIDEIYSDGKEAVAEIKLPQFLLKDAIHFILHPSIIDGALQSIIGVDLGEGSGPYIPFSIGEVNIRKPVVDSVYVYINVNNSESSHGGRLRKVNMAITDLSGKILVDIKNIALRELRHAGDKNDSTNVIFLENVWVHKEHAKNMAESRSEKETLLLIDAPDMLCGFDSFNKIFFSTEKKAESNFPPSKVAESQNEDIHEFLEKLRNQGASPDKIVIYAPDTAGIIDLTDFMLEKTYYFIQELIRALMKFKTGKEIRLLYIYSTGSQKDNFPFYSGISGFFKTLHNENPDFICKTIGVEDYSQNTIITGMEFLTDTEECEVLYSGGERLVKEFKEIEIAEGAEQLINLKKGGVYLVTGGMGALGYSFASYLACEIQANVVLVGRSPLDDIKQDKIRCLEESGSRAVYFQADLSVREEVQLVFLKVKELFNSIDGIIHCAGVIKDSFIIKKTRGEMDEVFRSKASGALNIDAVTANENLDFFVMFSSIAGVVGNPGQSDYAYSNRFLDAYAQYRETLKSKGMRSGKTISIQWPYWQDGGMALSKEYIEDIRGKTGMLALTIDKGVKIFRRILSDRYHEIAVLYGDAKRMRETVKDHSQYESEGMTMKLPESSIVKPQLIEKTQNLLKEILSAETKLPVARINARDTLQKYGIDSLLIVKINRELEKYFGELSKTLLFEYQTLEELAVYLVENYGARAAEVFAFHNEAENHKERVVEAITSPGKIEAMRMQPNKNVMSTYERESNYANEEIAIIGLSGKYPMADDLDSLWENLKDGRDCITEIPKERWEYEKYFDPAKNKKGKTNSKWGGFINDVGSFDPLFFNITPGEAEWIDPQERLFLETVWHTVEDAGYTRQSLKNCSVGVFVGLMYAQYNLFETDVDGTIMHPVGSYASIANRVSYIFNFRGPSIALDTMCSSSLTTIHLACESIRRGECNAAVAGGVNITIHPNKHLHLSMGGFASSDGRCRSFGDGGDGYVPGEGVGAVFLKPLKKAIHDGDRIYGVINSSFINHGGKTNGYTVPNPVAQTDLILNVLEQSKWNPETISYIEAHGTGTSLGDPIEINSLTKAFRKYTKKSQFCSIGSIKSNIGHLESAAGIAGLSKLLLMMKYKKLVPSIHSNIINENIDFKDSPFHIQSKLQEWEPVITNEDGKDVLCPRRAAISAFGAGGANAHILMEEYISDSTEEYVLDNDSQPILILLSAKTKDRLKEYASNLARYLKTRDENTNKAYLASVAYTLQTGREAMEHRLAMTVLSLEELIEKLDGFVNANEMGGQLFIGSTLGENSGVSILVDGEEGKQYLQSLIDKRRFSKLAQLWTCGIDVEWKAIYGDVHPPVTSIPGYPFAKGHYWIQPPNRDRMPENIKSLRLHPFIHSNTSTLHKQKFTSGFAGDEFFLQDHVVSGQKILPGVVQIEMARVAGELAGEARVSGLKEVIWSHPCEHNGSLVTVQTGISTKDGSVLFDITSGEDRQQKIISRGEIIYNEQCGGHERISIEKIKDRCFGTLSSGKAYELFDSMGLHYGPGLQSIHEVYYNQNEALSLLMLPDKSYYSEDEVNYHPALMDGALQTMIGLLLNGEGNDSGMYLPFAVGKVEFAGNLKPECYAYVVNKNDAGSKELHFDIQVTDTDGVVLLAFTNLQIKQANNSEQLMLFCREWQQEEIPGGNEKVQLDSKTLVFDISGQLGDALKKSELDYSWGIPIYVIRGNCFQKLGDRSFQINFSNAADYGLLFAHLKKTGEFFENIVYYSLKNDLPVLDEEQINNELDESLLYQLSLLQTFSKEFKNRVGFLYVYGGGNNLARVLQAGVKGLAQVVRLEHTNILYKTLEVDHSYSYEQIQKIIASELKYTGQGAVNIFYDGGRRMVEAISENNALTGHLGNAPFKYGGIYWITGGLGALGSIVANYLLQKYKARLILSGRSDLNAEGQTKLNGLRKSGVEVIYCKGDITDHKCVCDIYEYIKSKFGRLDGIIHTAGLTGDSLITNKDIEKAAKVIAPKILGTINLDEVTKDENLDIFVMFSSISGVFGNYGQADYAYANVFLDHFARYRKGLVARNLRRGRTLSAIWPFWKDGAMKVPHNTLEHLKQNIGVYPLSTDNGIHALEYGLLQDSDHIIAIQGNGTLLRKMIGNVYRYIQEPAKYEPKTINNTDDNSIYLLLKQIIIEETKLRSADITPDEVWANLGIDSTVNLRLIAALEKHFGELSRTLFFEYTNLKDLTRYFKQQHFNKLQELVSNSSDSDFDSVDPVNNYTANKTTEFRRSGDSSFINLRTDNQTTGGIAIIGISGRYPKSANLEEFWENLKKGENCISEIPAERWDHSLYFDSRKGRPGKAYSKWGGFLDKVDRFDPLFFKISPREAISMDPQQRVFMETAWHTLEDAGYPASNLKGKPVGVFVGVMYGQYQLFNSETEMGNNGTVLDSSYAAVANRVSYFFDFRGPSIAVDTMCSSSLSSIHLACQSIRAGECEMALAGGVNLTIHPSKYVNLSQGNFISSEGLCRSFGSGGDGYVPGEGVGAVLLKPLEMAIEDGDMIYAVIRGSSVNHGGKSSGYTVPNPKAQSEVIDMGLKMARWKPETISYLEAHGTGTSLGDPIEMRALSEVFGTSGNGRKCSIGSVKSNIGHLESASGIAGLTKVILMMKNKTLVKSLHAETLNPLIDFNNMPFYVQRTMEKWEQPDSGLPLRAGVSSFGAGGSNAHLLIEDYNAEADEQKNKHFKKQIVVISAKTSESVRSYADNLTGFLSKNIYGKDLNSEALLCNVAYTLQIGREEMENRLAIVAEDMAELIEKLKLHSEGKTDVKGVYTGQTSLENNESYTQISNNIKDEESIAELWASGRRIDWKALYQGYLPRHISLPGYVFEQKRCWFDTALLQTSAEAEAVSDTNPAGVQPEDAWQEECGHSEGTHAKKIVLKKITYKEAASLMTDNFNIALTEAAVTHPEQKPTEDGNELKSAAVCPDIRCEIENAMMDVLYLDRDDIDVSRKFSDLGMDSVLAIELAKRLSKIFLTEIKTVDLYEHNTVDLLAAKLQTMLGASSENVKVAKKEETIGAADNGDAVDGDFNKPSGKSADISEVGIDRQSTASGQEDIAVIGISGRYPMSGNIEIFWENLRQSKNCIEEVPLERWDYRTNYDSDIRKEDKISSKWGGFIKDIDKFDPLLFNISPREAAILDPQVRIMLELVWEAIEDAGYSRLELQKKTKNGQHPKVGVFIGSMYLQYPWAGEEKEMGSLLSNSSYWSIANRISYFFNFKGPSMAIDTACSSSMTAIHLACESIRNGESTISVAGGVNLSLIPNKYMGISQMGMLSSKEDSRCLGDSDGYVPGEGAGVVLLKPVSRAIMDRDHIYAVIKGSGISHNGQTEGFTLPDADAQAALIIETLEKSGVHPRTISYMELSATGSPTGDAAEIEGISKAFRLFTTDKSFCSIGTVKSNIGHVEASSGIAQLTKVILQLRNRQLVPTLNWQPLNPKIKLEGSPFYIQKDLQVWEQRVVTINGEEVEYPFRASINSFGAGGSNSHVILEEYINPTTSYTKRSEKVLFLLSARKKETLNDLIISMRNFFMRNRELTLDDVAFTLQVGREAMEERLAIITDSWDDLLDKLQGVIDGREGMENVLRSFIMLGAGQNVLLESTEYTAECIQEIVRKGSLDKIAELWMKGACIDWSLMPGNKDCQRLTLPQYPFDKKSYWIWRDKTSMQANAKNDGKIMLIQLKTIFSELSNLPVNEIDEYIELKRYGFDSLSRMRLINRIREKFGIEVPVSKVLAISTLYDIWQFINERIKADSVDEVFSELLDKLESGELTPDEVLSKYGSL